MTRIKNAHIGITWVGEKRSYGQVDEAADLFLRGMKYHPDNIESDKDWDVLAKELWGSSKFLLKRIEEQERYIEDLNNRYNQLKITLERKLELLCSAVAIKTTLELRLKEISC